MIHQQSKIFYRSGAGKQKRCQWWNTDYALGDKWFTSRVRYSTEVEQENLKDVIDITLIIPSGTNDSPAE
jgi:hypothetical protein